MKENNISKVGIVSTSATIQNKLYETAFQENGISFEVPDDFQQAKLGKIIHNLVMGQQNNKDREEIIKMINDFEKKDVGHVILACTDLQLLIPNHPRLKIYDTMKIFADSAVNSIISE